MIYKKNNGAFKMSHYLFKEKTMAILRESDFCVGKRIFAKFKVNPDQLIFRDVYLPLMIVAEYPEWWLCEVLSHKNPYGWGMSQPYKVTIRKHDIICGDVEAKGER